MVTFPWSGRGLRDQRFRTGIRRASCHVRSGCRTDPPVSTLVVGVPSVAGHPSGRQTAADTGMAIDTSPVMCAGHQLSGRRLSRKQRTVNPPIAPARHNFLCSSQAARRPGSDTTVTGEPVPAARAGRSRPGLASLDPLCSVAQPLLPLSRRLVQLHRRHRGGSGSPSSSSGVMGSRRTSTTSKPCDRIRSSRLQSAVWSCTGPYNTISAGSTLTVRPLASHSNAARTESSGDQQGGSRSFHHRRAPPTPPYHVESDSGGLKPVGCQKSFLRVSGHVTAQRWCAIVCCCPVGGAGGLVLRLPGAAPCA
jgi:hypothetical protein